MQTGLPATVQALLDVEDRTGRDSAWSGFLGEFGGLILHVARSMGGDHDTVMDRYAFVLDRLREEDFRRLRRYSADGRGKFSTWFVVVLRRLCLDEHRHRYGRTRRDNSPADEGERRRLADLVAAEIDVDTLDPETETADIRFEKAETRAKLLAALAALDAPDRLLLRLRFEDDLSVPEASRVLGFPSAFHGYRRLSAVLEILRKHLVESGIDGVGP